MTEDDYWTDDYKLQLLQTRYYDEFIKMMEGIADKMSVDMKKLSHSISDVSSEMLWLFYCFSAV